MTRRAAILFAAGAAVAAVAGAGLTAAAAVAVLETRVTAQVQAALAETDDWVGLSANGTLLTITGTAPDRAVQIAALARIGSAAGGISIVDETTVGDEDAAVAESPEPAELSLELLRSGEDVTLFGTVPRKTRDGFAGRHEAIADLRVTDMLSAAGGAIDPRWQSSVELGVAALALMDRGRISVVPGAVSVSASAPSDEVRQEWLSALEGMVAAAAVAVDLQTDIAVPRQVVSPYVFRARIGQDGALQVLACTAENQEAADRLLALHGGSRPATCTVGLGAPSPEWEEAVLASVGVLRRLGAGAVDFADADVSLTGPQGHDAGGFAKTVDQLAAGLPKVFSLSASLPPPVAGPDLIAEVEPPRFTAVRTEDGAVRIRGDVNDDRIRETAATFAEAKFGFNTVINETVPRDDLPSGWAVRVVSGLEALGLLTTGQLEVTDATVTLTGATATPEDRNQIEELLHSRLPDDVEVSVEVWEAEALEVSTPFAVPAELCAEQIDLILSTATINFPPSETAIDEPSLPIIDRIAEVLGTCPGARFEIGGHTDSQGRESSNMALSQSRADAVLAALLERNVDTVFLFARGYGETQPIADNDTEEGRARNRRIAFQLVPDQTDATVPPDDADGPSEVMAEAEPPVEEPVEEEVSEIDTARRESPTTIVVPAGTDPASVLPPAAQSELQDSEGEAEPKANEAFEPLVVEEAPEIIPPLRPEELETASLPESEGDVDGASDRMTTANAGEMAVDVLDEGGVAEAGDAEAVSADAPGIPDDLIATEEGAAASDDTATLADASDTAGDSATALAEDAAEMAPAEADAAGTDDGAATAAPEPADDPDLVRPMPRKGNLPGSGD